MIYFFYKNRIFNLHSARIISKLQNSVKETPKQNDKRIAKVNSLKGAINMAAKKKAKKKTAAKKRK